MAAGWRVSDGAEKRWGGRAGEAGGLREERAGAPPDRRHLLPSSPPLSTPQPPQPLSTQLPVPGRGGPHGGHRVRGGHARDSVLLPGAAPDAHVQRDHAHERQGLCRVGAGGSRGGQRRPRRRRQPGRGAGARRGGAARSLPLALACCGTGAAPFCCPLPSPSPCLSPSAHPIPRPNTCTHPYTSIHCCTDAHRRWST